MKLETIPGLTVSLTSNDAALPELECFTDSSNEASPVRSGYVEAASGSCFAIKIAVEPTSPYATHMISMVVFMDGKKIGRRWHEVSGAVRTEGTIRGVWSTQDGRYFFQRFQFAELETTDGDAGQISEAVVKGLGSVSIDLYRARVTKSTGVFAVGVVEPAVRGPVAETCVKGRALSRCIGLSPVEEHVARKDTGKIEHVEPGIPFARFVFKYRSRHDLEVEGIVSQKPASAPTPSTD